MGKQLIFDFDNAEIKEAEKENSLYNWCLKNDKHYILDEWNYDKNEPFIPENISYASNKKFWWKCSKGHEWQSNCNHRTCKLEKCPTCQKEKAAIYYSTVKDINESLLVKNPELVKEWDYEKNDRGPETYYPQSNLKVFWKCKNGHSWETSISHRVRGRGCPYCAGQKVETGFNDLATLQPELMKSWDYEKNALDPTKIGIGHKAKAYWLCEKGHSWKADINSRTNRGRGCPYCNKERRTSLPEKIIYFYLSKHYKDIKENEKLEGFGKLELDIYLPSIKTGIEYDGCNWHKNITKDLNKDILCSKSGIKLIRIRELGCPKYDSEAIKIETPKYSSNFEFLNEPLNNVLSILGLSCDVNISGDLPSIIAHQMTLEKENSIARNKEAMEEWDWDKNKNVNPEFISAQSNVKFYWKCKKCGYEWKVSPAHKNRGHGCPVCANQAVKKGYNDLLSQRPDIAKEWDYSKNLIGPDKVTYQSVKSYYWTCSKCGYSWKTKVSVRTSLGCGCPVCCRDKISEKQRYCEESESLAFLEPELIKEWDYEKNTLNPKHIRRACNEKAFWKCSKGHSWESAINSRLNGKNKCPYCSGRFAIVGENDLATTHPQLIKEWDYNKNEFTPQQVKAGTHKKAWWICKKCGYKWETLVNVRTRGCGCPRCKGKVK